MKGVLILTSSVHSTVGGWRLQHTDAADAGGDDTLPLLTSIFVEARHPFSFSDLAFVGQLCRWSPGQSYFALL